MTQYVGVLTLFFAVIAFRGLVLSKLWLWFVVPLGVVAIHPAWAFGMAILIMSMTPYVKDERKINTEEWINAFLRPLFSLFFGWLVHIWWM